ncbi:MAG: DUF3800 domain-containing protein [Patescibacteria group bacterium]
MLKNTYNIYCDESRIDNTDSQKMAIGALIIPRNSKKAIVQNIKSIYQKYNFGYELKWTKVHKKFFDFYKKIIDYFVFANDLKFRCIIVDKTQVKLKEYHNEDFELAFFKFYYLMLKAKLLDNNTYYIFLDKKPTRDKNRARALHAFLDSYVLWNKKNCSISHFQAYDSKNNVMIQLADFLVGLVSFACNNKDTIVSPKRKVAEYLKDKLQIKNFDSSSFLNEKKFNIFVWDSNLCKK